MNTNTNNQLSPSAQQKAELLKEFVTNDPYLAFFIHFFSDLGIEPLLTEPLFNPHTNTKVQAIDRKTIIIQQNQKSLNIKISEAKKLLEHLYGPMPLIIEY